MEQRSVSIAEIIDDLENVITDIRAHKYSSISLSQNIMVSEVRISNDISESHQIGRQIMIVLGRADGTR